MQTERARRIEEKRQRRKYDRQMQRRQEYVARCREELEDRRRRVGAAAAWVDHACPRPDNETQ